MKSALGFGKTQTITVNTKYTCNWHAAKECGHGFRQRYHLHYNNGGLRPDGWDNRQEALPWAAYSKLTHLALIYWAIKSTG